MRIVVQRCSRASVSVENHIVGKIGRGLLLLVGITHGDSEKDAAYLAEKVSNLRIFEDGDGKMNLSLPETGGEILSVSQFTLYGDCRKGRRPNFMEAALPEHARAIFDAFNSALRERGLHVETGVFGESMEIDLTNSGPVTLILDSKSVTHM